MKSKLTTVLFCAIISIIFGLSSCKSTYLTNVENGKKIDNRLIGKWTGTEKDNYREGMTTKWVKKRYSDGVFYNRYIITINKKTFKSAKNGNWWIKKGEYYEYDELTEKTDLYLYEFIDTNKVVFKPKNLSVELLNPKCEFVDTKVKK